MNRLLIFLATLSVSFALSAAEGFSSLEEQMSGKEFEEAGLNKLSQEELAALNAWIRRHSLATLDPADATASSADRRGFEDEGDNSGAITSRLMGKFSGWDGQTTFRLENGMIWAQADKDKFYVKEVENPVVSIERSMFGRWNLKVEGHDSECRVRRIQ
jgi:hypothetical protein